MKQILFALLVSLPSAVFAQNVALVIGNSKYRSVAELPNPQNDSTAVSRALTEQGFDVVTGNNLERGEMLSALREFRDKADSAEIALVYYAGHGIEIAGTNYLMPVDATLVDERDAGLEMIDVDLVLRQISGSRTLKMVVLDACRNNPFVTKMKRENAGRNVGRGLAIVDSTEADTLIAYAAAAGEVTPDGEAGKNSPFTTAFLNALSGPPTDVRRLLGAVRDQMRQSVPGAAPFIYSSLGGGEYVINPRSEALKPEVPASVTPVQGTITQDFIAADKAGSVAEWDAFLIKHETQIQHPLYAFALQRRQAIVDRQEAELARERETQIEVLDQNNPTTAVVGAAQSASGSATVPEATKENVARELQTLLKARGCYNGAIDGIWGKGSTAGLSRFLKVAGSPLVAHRSLSLAEMTEMIPVLTQNANLSCPRSVPSRQTAARPANTPVTPEQPAAAPVQAPAEIPEKKKGRNKRSWANSAYCQGSATNSLQLGGC